MMVDIASQSSSWRWLSDVQKPEFLGMYMKGVTIWLLALFQKIFRDKKSMVPLVALWATANLISTILIFLIASNYFNPLIGFILGLFFITSFWPWQTALTMGHINIATAIFLAGVYSSTQIINPAGIISPIWLIIAGIFFACLFFSSSSAIKYFPFAFVSLIFAKYRPTFEHEGVSEAIRTVFVLRNETLFTYIIVPIALVLLIIVGKLSSKWLVTRMYTGNASSWFIKILTFFGYDLAGKHQFTLNHYVAHAEDKIRQATKWISGIYLFGAFILYPLGLYFILLVLLGSMITIIIFTFPNIKKGVSFYWHYIRETQIRQKTAFRGWDEYFAAKGVKVSRYFTANGFVWLPKFFLKFIPGPILIFYASIVFVVISKFVQRDGLGLINAIIILSISLLPCIWGELTNSPKLGRVYLSAYPGLLLFIGYTLRQINPDTLSRLSPLIFFILAGIFTWNVWKFFNDIFPARMAIANLIKLLDDRGIKEFYTYRTDYNQHFVGTIRPELREKYTIHYINNLAEVKNGWIVIPGASLKTSFWVTENMRSGIDSIKDPMYNKLMETKKIELIATAKLKTFGSSPLWVLDSEITSFHDLILNDIKPRDFFRSYAWLLHSQTLANL